MMSDGRYQKPASAGDFFTWTIAVLVGIVGVVVVFGICVGISLLVCSGTAMWFPVTVAEEVTKEAQKKGRAVAPIVMAKAQQYGVSRIEDGATVMVRGEVASFNGDCIIHGHTVPISAEFRVPPGIGATDYEWWQLRELEVDDEVVYSTVGY